MDLTQSPSKFLAQWDQNASEAASPAGVALILPPSASLCSGAEGSGLFQRQGKESLASCKQRRSNLRCAVLIWAASRGKVGCVRASGGVFAHPQLHLFCVPRTSRLRSPVNKP